MWASESLALESVNFYRFLALVWIEFIMFASINTVILFYWNTRDSMREFKLYWIIDITSSCL